MGDTGTYAHLSCAEVSSLPCEIVQALLGSVFLGSRLDVEASLSTCRLAFEGCILRLVIPPHPTEKSSSASASHSSVQGRAPKGTQPYAGNLFKGQKAASAAPKEALAPLPLTALRVVRRKWRVGVVDRFFSDGNSLCTCDSNPPTAPLGGASESAQSCTFRSSSLVVRGLFTDAQHAHSFGNFRVALVQATKEEAERQLERGEGEAVYDACLSICLPSLAARTPANSNCCSIQPALPQEAEDGREKTAEQTPKRCDEKQARRSVLVWPARLAVAFGGKGKCHVDLLRPLTCSEAGVFGALGASQFCVVLMYCKSCFNRDHSILQP